MTSLTSTYTLSGGVKIPCIGYGTWLVPDDDTGYRTTREAIDHGYRHIDTAAYYKNEAAVGRAVRESGVPRRDLFVTSKVWAADRGYDRTLAAFSATLDRLGLDHLDLYLIHWPAPVTREGWQEENRETWRAMEKLRRDGLVRAIGVSNFLPHHLESLCDGAEITPAVNQIEFHPGFMQEETVAFCRSRKILIEAWSPLGRGRIFEEPILLGLAEKYGKSLPQICLRWCLQHNVLPLPKTSSSARMAENADIFDFVLTKTDMMLIDTLPAMGFSGQHPDEVDF